MELEARVATGVGAQGCQAPAGHSGWRGLAWVGSVEDGAGDRKERSHLGWEIPVFGGKASVEGAAVDDSHCRAGTGSQEPPRDPPTTISQPTHGSTGGLLL